MDEIEILKGKVEELKTAWTLENTEVSDKLRIVETLVSGSYTQEELELAIADVRSVIESVEPRISNI